MLGTVRTHLTRMATWLKTRLQCYDIEADLWHYLNIGVSTIMPSDPICNQFATCTRPNRTKNNCLHRADTLLVTLMKLASVFLQY